MENNAPLVPRNVYTQAILKELHTVPYDPAHHNGMRNPYSQKHITCQEDYEEYVREYVYYRLCDEFLRRQYEVQMNSQTAKLSKQFDTRLATQTKKLEKQHQNEIDQIYDHYNNDFHILQAQYKKTLYAWGWRWISAIFALILIFLWFLSWYVPGKETDARHAGETSGYQSGYQDGLKEGRMNNETGSRSSSSDNTSSDREPVSADPTEPKSWIDLDRTVYVSRNNKIHLNSSCSGMKYFTEMTYGDACAAGCFHCRTCF